jgi:hypothetical protein
MTKKKPTMTFVSENNERVVQDLILGFLVTFKISQYFLQTYLVLLPLPVFFPFLEVWNNLEVCARKLRLAGL